MGEFSIDKYREAKIQKTIEEFCNKYNLSKLENEVMTPEMKVEIIESLIGCGLSIRTISDILGAPYSSIQKQFKKIIELNEGGQKEPSLMIFIPRDFYLVIFSLKLTQIIHIIKFIRLLIENYDNMVKKVFNGLQNQ